VKLPNPDKAVLPRDKIEGYLLSPVHSVGRHKAAFLHSLGYTQADWQELERDLRELATGEARQIGENDFGMKYEIRGVITGPGGRSAAIVTAWIVLNDEDFPRFITAYPEA
jgi:hypothetical protein